MSDSDFKLDVLAISTHPDDVELFCAGTLIKMARAGYSTGVVDLTKGELGTRGNAELRIDESKAAAKVLQVKVRENAGIADGNIENSSENRLLIIDFIRKYRPAIVLAPYWEDRHPDHIHASQLVSEACFYSGLEKIKTNRPAFRPESVIYYFHHTVKNPSFIVDISDEFKLKLEAVKAYSSQFFDPKSNEPETYISSSAFWQSIETRARHYGFQVGSEYGEPFYVKSMIKINNLLENFA